MSAPLHHTGSEHDDAIDVLVVGSGAAGMAAALSAAIGGCRVLLIEKTDRIGGSTAISGGAVWAPLNHQSADAGHPDTWDAACTYLRNTVGDAAPLEMQHAFLRACGPAIHSLEEHTQVQLAARTYSPDYYPDRDGAALGGRSLDPLPFDGRTLGRHFRVLRDPLPEFMVLGGMMVTLTDAKHLLAATRSARSCWEGIKLVLRYAGDRLRGYHRGTRLVLGNALAARLFRSLLDRGIPYQLATALQSLHVQDGRVTGAVVTHHGKPHDIRVRKGVVIATGGFPWNQDMRARLYPQPTGPWSMVPTGNVGEGITIAQAAGAAMGSGHASPAFWAPVSILQRPDGSQLRYPHLVWDRAKPGLMAVNAAGQRFVNESTSYHEFVRAMYHTHAQAPAIPAVLLCDSDFMETWGLGLALPGGRPREHLIRAGYLYRADTLNTLAQTLNLDIDALHASVQQFNHAAQTGEDTHFGKGSTAYNRYLGDTSHHPNPCLGPLRTAPFYAVNVYPGDIGTACGIRCNPQAQALDANGNVIPGLYVVGNDMHSVMGGQYPAPGITLGPALTFGWVAGQQLAQSSLHEVHP